MSLSLVLHPFSAHAFSMPLHSTMPLQSTVPGGSGGGSGSGSGDGSNRARAEAAYIAYGERFRQEHEI